MQGDPVTARAIRTEVIDLVPINVLAEVTQDFKDSGTTEIKAEPDPDGTWKISAMLWNRQ
ncbi:MAG TPA: hypothetical protein VND19_02690 [Acetobacteraceae bacterium]|nr:hypothetical protein [Acetobacteraceae bacterium]